MTYSELVTATREMNKDVEIRVVGDGGSTSRNKEGGAESEIADFLSLMNKAYKRKKGAAYVRWQFIDTPFPARMLLAYLKGTPIACYGMQIKPLSNGERCGFAIDQIVLPFFFKRQIPLLLESHLREFAKEHGATVLFALPNPAGCEALSRVPDWEVIGDVSMLELNVKDHSSFVESLDRSCGSNLNSKLSGFEKDDSYLAWRYDRNPDYDYERIAGPKSSQICIKVFAVPNSDIRIGDTRIGDIVDYDFGECDVGDAATILEKAIQSLVKDKVQSISTWALPHSPEFALFQSRGFRPSANKRKVCVASLERSSQHLLSLDAWRLVPGDSEVF